MATLRQTEWFGFNHEKVRERFEGSPEFVGEFDMDGTTWAVYSVAEPNRAKGHKDFMLLTTGSLAGSAGDAARPTIVSGRDRAGMEPYRLQHAVHCLECDSVIYSVHRHDYRGCGCPNEAVVDGGRDYFRFGAADMSRVRRVTLDLLAGRMVE
jgi:hypothetical protein